MNLQELAKRGPVSRRPLGRIDRFLEDHPDVREVALAILRDRAYSGNDVAEALIGSGCEQITESGVQKWRARNVK